jgi:hypothetical protein
MNEFTDTAFAGSQAKGEDDRGNGCKPELFRSAASFLPANAFEHPSDSQKIPWDKLLESEGWGDEFHQPSRAVFLNFKKVISC